MEAALKTEAQPANASLAKVLADQLDRLLIDSRVSIEVLEDGRWLAQCLGTTWRPTGIDFAAFAEEAEELLTLYPKFPLVECLIDLPPVPGRETSIEILGWLADSLSKTVKALGDARSSMELEVRLVRSMLAKSSFGDWHVNGFDPWAQVPSVRVAGRDLRLSPWEPAGSPQDLSTLFLGDLLNGKDRGDLRRGLRVIAIDIGSKRIKVSINSRGGGPARFFWVDFAAMSATPTTESRKP